jgi:putative ABC transport system permease protein
MNLSTARASKRAKEVGVRKVFGAEKEILLQVIHERIFFAFTYWRYDRVAFIIIVLPYLNNVTQADVRLTMFSGFTDVVYCL